MAEIEMKNQKPFPPENAKHFSGLKHVMAKID